MKTLNENIRVLSGSTDIVLVAPHGLAKDDENTDRVTQQTADRLACEAIINIMVWLVIGIALIAFTITLLGISESG